MALGNKIVLEHDITPNLKLFFSEVELQRICDNNISNAIKYSLPESEVFITLKRDKEMLLLEVTSVGTAIKDPEQLFKRYYREGSARGGFGIGLHIVKEICDKHAVKVDVQSANNQNSFQYYFKEYHENLIT